MSIPATRRTGRTEARPAVGRVFVACAAIITLIVVGLISLLAGPASASPLTTAGNAVGVIGYPAGPRVGVHEQILAGQGQARAPNYDQTVSASCVGPDDLPLEQINATDGTTTSWYLHDQDGSTRALVDNTGNLVASFTYDPYGNLTNSTGTASTPLLWQGQYRGAVRVGGDLLSLILFYMIVVDGCG